MRVAVVGNDVSAALAVAAAQDRGSQVEVFAGSDLQVPYPGSLYLRELPPELQERYPPVHHLETVWGLDPKLYSLRKWGQRVETNVERVFEYMVKTQESAMERDVWPVSPGLLHDLTMGAEHHRVEPSAELVRDLSATHDLVVVTEPISFTPGAPRLGHSLLLPFEPSKTELLEVSQLDGAFLLLAWMTDKTGEDSLTIYNAHTGPAWLKVQSLEDRISVELPSTMTDVSYWLGLGLPSEDAKAVASWLSKSTVRLPKVHPNNPVCNRSPALNVMLCGEVATWTRELDPSVTYSKVDRFLAQLDQVQKLVG